jgi:hypothetical protein
MVDTSFTLSADQYIQLVISRLPRSLVAESDISNLIGNARMLPAADPIGFEVYLGKQTGPPSLAICIEPATDAARSLARMAEVDTKNNRDAVLLNSLTRFCAAWVDSESKFLDEVINLWIEIDRKDFTAQPKPLRTFVGVSRTSHTLDTVLHVLRLLGASISPSSITILSRCLDKLPLDTLMVQIGVAPGLASTAVRICSFTTRIEDAKRFIRSTAASGTTCAAETLLTMMQHRIHGISVALDVVDEILPQIGLELYPEDRRVPVATPRWIDFLQELVIIGQCTPQQRDALLAWPGVDSIRLLWPRTVLRGLNHVKVTVAPNSDPWTKAYLGFTLEPAAIAMNGRETLG